MKKIIAIFAFVLLCACSTNNDSFIRIEQIPSEQKEIFDHFGSGNEINFSVDNEMLKKANLEGYEIKTYEIKDKKVIEHGSLIIDLSKEEKNSNFLVTTSLDIDTNKISTRISNDGNIVSGESSLKKSDIDSGTIGYTMNSIPEDLTLEKGLKLVLCADFVGGSADTENLITLDTLSKVHDNAVVVVIELY